MVLFIRINCWHNFNRKINKKRKLNVWIAIYWINKKIGLCEQFCESNFVLWTKAIENQVFLDKFHFHSQNNKNPSNYTCLIMVLSNVEWNNHINEDNNNSIKREIRRNQSSDRDHSKCMCFIYTILFNLYSCFQFYTWFIH